ncbi:unnamed protein product, partial [Heterosigma akashiwo]
AAAEGPAHPYKEEMYVPATGKKVHTGVLEKAQLEEWAFSEQYHTFHQFGWAQDSQGQVVASLPATCIRYIYMLSSVQRVQGGMFVSFVHQGAGRGATFKLCVRHPKGSGREPLGEEQTADSRRNPTEAKARGELYESLQSDFERGALTEEQRKFRETFEAERKAKYREYDMEEDHDRAGRAKRGHLLPPRHNRDTRYGAPRRRPPTARGERDYQGRSWLAPPKGASGKAGPQGLPCRCEERPDCCVHKWTGHTKGVNHVEWLPGYGHLLLSCSMDSRSRSGMPTPAPGVKRTYSGHSMGVREARFNSTGAQFVTVSFDRFARVWDTETGQAVSTFTNRKVPYCATFYPEDENIFLAGCSDNQVRSALTRQDGEIVQLYNHHLGPVNTVTFRGGEPRIVTTSDDKKILVWEYNIPVPITYISEPHMHSMPAVTVHPRGNLREQHNSLNNEIHVYTAAAGFKQMRKKVFKGHVNAGTRTGGEGITFSPNGKYMASGDAEGKFFVWDWGSTRIYKRLNAHENGPCISAAWHPVEPSWVATCGWDGLIKLWD